ncbi:hypothetical protein A4X13_0g7365, partial [Tilletia indica]
MTEAVSPEAEADLIHLVAKFHFDILDRDKFNAAVDQVQSAPRTLKRDFKAFRVVMMQTEPGEEIHWDQCPPIVHKPNQQMLSQLEESSSFSGFVNWCDSQQTKSQVAPITTLAPKGKTQAPETTKGKGPDLPRQTKLLLPLTQAKSRRKSRSPARLRDFDLSDNDAGPSKNDAGPSKPRKHTRKGSAGSELASSKRAKRGRQRVLSQDGP